MLERVYNLHRNNKINQKNTSYSYRKRKLKQLRAVLIRDRDIITQAVQKDLHKAPLETELTEIMPVVSAINLALKELKSWMKDEKVSTPMLFKGCSSYIRYEAKGNVLVLAPWNYPFQLSVYPVVTSFIAGNTTILKPSEFTPHTNKMVAKIFKEVFEESEVTLIEGAVKESQQLLALDFDHICFTGSTAVGKIVMEAASKNLASVSLELGGKSPVFLDKKTAIDEAMKKICWGKLVNSGQTCVAPDYLLTFKENLKEVEKSFKKYVKEFYGKDLKSSQDFCHIITAKHCDRIMNLIKDAVDKGAKVLHGGKKLSDKIVEPTLLVGVTREMTIMQEEIFGPVLPVMTVDDINQALKIINEEDNPLTAYIFSDRSKTVDSFLEGSFSGGVTINDTLINAGNASLPFGGAGKSGIGNYHGHDGFKEFSNARGVMSRNYDLGASFFYPPYTADKYKIVKGLFKNLPSIF